MKITNNIITNITKTLCLAAVVALLLVSVFVYHAPATSFIGVLLFFVFYVLLPGAFIIKTFGINPKYKSSHIILSIFSGWALCVGLYFITTAIDNNLILYVVGPASSIALMFTFYKEHNKEKKYFTLHWNDVSAALCVAIVLALVYALLRTQFVYLNPAIASSTYLNPDKVYHLGLINSLSHDYPLANPWIQGRVVHYHIFTEILYAIAIRLFGFTADFMMISFGPFFTTSLLCLCLYSLFKEYCSKKNNAGMYTLAVILSHMYISKGPTTSLAYKFLLENDNSAGYGVSCAIGFVVLLKYVLENNLSRKDVILRYSLLTIFLMLNTGIKGPIGLVMLGAVWGTMILAFILGNKKVKDCVPLLIMSIAFLIVYKTIFASSGQSGNTSGGESIFAFAKLTNICFWKEPLINFLNSFGVPSIIRLAFIMLVFLAFFFSAFFLPFCIGYIREFALVISKKKDFDFARVTIYAASLVGIVLMLILHYHGNSQIYFGFITTIFAPLISFWFFEDVSGMDKNKLSWLYSLTKVVFCITLVIASTTLLAHMVGKIDGVKAHANPDNKTSIYLSISRDEYAGMQWIKNNTPEDSLLAVDRYASVPPEEYTYENRWSNRYFFYPVYSNRFAYITGCGYSLDDSEWPVRKEMLETNAKLYDIENAGRGDLARELGIDYVVVSKRINPVGDLSNEDYELCYSNPEMDIYKINK